MSITSGILLLAGRFILSLMLLLTILLILITFPLVWLADQLLQLTHSLIKSTCHVWPDISKDSKIATAHRADGRRLTSIIAVSCYRRGVSARTWKHKHWRGCLMFHEVKIVNSILCRFSPGYSRIEI